VAQGNGNGRGRPAGLRDAQPREAQKLTPTVLAAVLRRLEAGGTVSAAARAVGVSRQALYLAMARGRQQPPGGYLRVWGAAATAALTRTLGPWRGGDRVALAARAGRARAQTRERPG